MSGKGLFGAFGILSFGAALWTSSVPALSQAVDPFTSACDAALEDIQENRRICVIGVVVDDTRVRVVYSSRPEVFFKSVELYQSPMQQSNEEPLQGLSDLTGQVVAVGGLENGLTIYSAELLSPEGQAN